MDSWGASAAPSLGHQHARRSAPTASLSQHPVRRGRELCYLAARSPYHTASPPTQPTLPCDLQRRTPTRPTLRYSPPRRKRHIGGYCRSRASVVARRGASTGTQPAQRVGSLRGKASRRVCLCSSSMTRRYSSCFPDHVVVNYLPDGLCVVLGCLMFLQRPASVVSQMV